MGQAGKYTAQDPSRFPCLAHVGLSQQIASREWGIISDGFKARVTDLRFGSSIWLQLGR